MFRALSNDATDRPATTAGCGVGLRPLFVAVVLGLAAAVAAPVAMTTPAYADSERGKKGKHKYERRDRSDDCEYRARGNHHRYREEVKCKHAAAFHGGPPPWAPAHGYRRKYGHTYYRVYEDAYRVPEVGIEAGRCNRAVVGAVIGGALGGFTGSRIGEDEGKLAATVAGTLIGILVGGSIGQSMDDIDQNCMGQTFEQAQDNQPVVWRNPDAGTNYKVIPTNTYEANDGRYCREYTAEAVVGGRVQNTYGMACRQPDGSWQLMN